MKKTRLQMNVQIASDAFKRWSLKSRVTVFTLVIFLVSLWSLSYYASRMLHQDLEEMLGQQQLATVSLVATELNQTLASRLKALQKVASGAATAIQAGRPAAQALLDQNSLLPDLFNFGVLVYGLDGTAMAEAPQPGARVGVNYRDNATVVAALGQGQSMFSEIHLGKTLYAPVFGISVPVRDAQGTVVGALSGVISLGGPNFLDNIIANRYGQTGGYLLIAPKQRLIITATDKLRIMEQLPPPGANPVLERFMDGYAGSAIYVNPLGVEVLVSYAGIAATGWIISAVLPTAEAFSPIQSMQQRLLLATLLLTVLAAALTWLMLRSQLAPMLTIVKALAKLADEDGPPQALTVAYQDELGELVKGFNRLLQTLAQRETALRDSEAHFRLLTEQVSDVVWRQDCNNVFTYISPADEHLRGFRADEVIGQHVFTLLTEEGVATVKEARQRRQDTEQRDEPTGGITFELQQRCKDGHLIWTEVLSTPERDAQGNITGYHGITRDVTERKQMQDQVRQLAFFDPLTLLPNRRMLDDRLRQTMAASSRTSRYGALIYLDLDNFKPLNDTHGHDAGDLLLMEVAHRLKASVREMDSVVRIGGDEFVVILIELDTDPAESRLQASLIAEKVRLALAEPYVLTVRHEGLPDKTVMHHCTASLGVTLFVNQQWSQAEVMKWADAAMYQAKDAGRNCVRFHGETMRSTL